jgi:hypothetical protein
LRKIGQSVSSKRSVLADPYRITDPLLDYWLRRRRSQSGPDKLE